MILQVVRNTLLIAGTSAFGLLSLCGHALHDAAAHNHGQHDSCAEQSEAAQPQAGGCPHHCSAGHSHAQQNSSHDETSSDSESQSGGHEHPPNSPHHDHDCLICLFTTLGTAILTVGDCPTESSLISDITSADRPAVLLQRVVLTNPRAPPA